MILYHCQIHLIPNVLTSKFVLQNQCKTSKFRQTFWGLPNLKFAKNVLKRDLCASKRGALNCTDALIWQPYLIFYSENLYIKNIITFYNEKVWSKYFPIFSVPRKARQVCRKSGICQSDDGYFAWGYFVTGGLFCIILKVWYLKIADLISRILDLCF